MKREGRGKKVVRVSKSVYETRSDRQEENSRFKEQAKKRETRNEIK
ncbi:hypothetical protein J2S74_005507 [Evansella vedderi]|uniref:Uncharacterized protein n=1 Tax=Evansella vedderi TaxID=38282 RepID=A0ABU0A3H2_9BACI|nr:hypothetical protein [Evansella vedderi]